MSVNMGSRGGGPPVGDPFDEALAKIDATYAERNRCVAFMAHLAHEAGFNVGTKPDVDPGWFLLFIDMPTGQISFHFQEKELPLLAGLPPYTHFLHKPGEAANVSHKVTGTWDGHTTEEKYARMERWTKGLYP